MQNQIKQINAKLNKKYLILHSILLQEITRNIFTFISQYFDLPIQRRSSDKIFNKKVIIIPVIYRVICNLNDKFHLLFKVYTIDCALQLLIIVQQSKQQTQKGEYERLSQFPNFSSRGEVHHLLTLRYPSKKEVCYHDCFYLRNLLLFLLGYRLLL